MKRLHRWMGILIMASSSSTALGEGEICKVTDPETGATTFSECATAGYNAEKIDVDIVNTMKSSDITRGRGFRGSSPARQALYKRQTNQAKETKQTPEEKLAAAKAIQPGDRVKTANGSRLSEAYLERVKRAEEEYKKNKK